MGQTRATPGSKENTSRKWGRESLLPIHVHLLFISWPFPVIHIIIHTCLVAFYGSHEQNYSCYCSTGNTARVAVQPALLCLLEQQTCLKIRSALPDAPTRRVFPLARSRQRALRVHFSAGKAARQTSPAPSLRTPARFGTGQRFPVGRALLEFSSENPNRRDLGSDLLLAVTPEA